VGARFCSKGFIMATDTNKRDNNKRVSSELTATLYPDLIEDYTPERLAEFLLNNSVTAEDYATALADVHKLGIDPATIPHQKPAGA
jgi:hypothetical protein